MDLYQEIKAVLSQALGDDRLSDLGPDDPILQSGLVSSMEIVIMVAALEQHFSLSIPDSEVTLENFATLGRLAALIQAKAEGKSLAPRDALLVHGLMKSVARVMKRPLMALLLVAALLASFELLLPLLMQGPLAGAYHRFLEKGQRLYPIAGGHSQDDMSFSVGHHEILRTRPQDRPRVVVFGDSGTVGSWLPASQAPSVYMQKELRKSLPQARVYNLAYFMPSVLKDFMILESILEHTGGKLPFEAVVFTLGDSHLSLDYRKHQLTKVPFIPLNHLLLKNFLDRVLGQDARRYEAIMRDLERADQEHHNFFTRWAKFHSALYHYGPFLRQLLDTAIYYPMDQVRREYIIGAKPLFEQTPEEPPEDLAITRGVHKGNLDRLVVELFIKGIDWLRAQGVKVVIYIEPRGPKQWRRLYSEPDGRDAHDIAQQICASGRCAVVDLRWSLSGDQFTDNVAHYTKQGNQVLGRAVGQTLAEELGP